MNRRDTVLALLILGAPPFATVAQQVARAWRVGFLSGASRLHVYDGLPKGMQELGYIEGQNLVIEWQVGNGNYERVPALASDLVRAKVDVIVAAGSPAVKAAKEATTSIPIVMVSVSDPVVSGYIPSLSRPGGNITGLSNIQA